MTHSIRHIRFVLIVLVVVSGLFGLSRVDLAEAHGKELTLTVSSLIPDRSEPLRRMYRVRAAYAGDLDAIEGAEVVMTGIRREGGELLGEHRFIELRDEPGVYVAEVVFDRFGDWILQIDLHAALGQGDGSASLTESVTPVVLSAADKTSLLTEADRVQRLQVFFAFEWWPDIVTIVIRVLHAMSAALYAGLVGAVLLAAWLGGTGNRILTGRLGANFLKLTLISLGGLLLSGMYSAAFDAPNAAPGIYEYRDLLQLPYGDAYFAAFLLKPAGWVLMVLFALRTNSVVIRPAIRVASVVPVVPSGAAYDAAELAGPAFEIATATATGAAAPARTETGLKKLIWAGTALSAIAIADLSLVIYLHYLSHLGVFLPEA